MFNKILVIFIMCLLVCWSSTGQCDSLPPLYDQIMKIMAPLEYSGVPVMVKPQVSLDINYAGRRWILRNIHEYDSQGVVLLEEGRYGLCAELATYLFEKIKPLLSDRYIVKFAMVTESEFFPSKQSNHIVLMLVDKANSEVYLIDPSFHRYAKIKDLPQYHVLNIQDSLSFENDKSHDIIFSVDQAIPLYIKNDYLLSFAVTSVDGKFDKDNFIFVISANYRNQSSGHDIVVIGRHNREFEDYEDKVTLLKLLTPDEIKTLFNKLKSWLAQV